MGNVNSDPAADPARSSPKFTADLKSILDHSRGQFQYHAGQRLAGIRHFFVAWAVFGAAYVTTFQSTQSKPLLQLILSTSALIITLAFWGLDARNASMVRVDEDALKEIENQVAKDYELSQFQMADSWEMKESWIFRRYILKYRFITGIIFGYLTLVSIGAVWHSVNEMRSALSAG